jgi:hypothetical protein
MRGASIISPYSHARDIHGLVANLPRGHHDEKVKQLNKKSAGRKSASHLADGGM